MWRSTDRIDLRLDPTPDRVAWNDTTILNIVFLALSAVPVTRFLRTVGPGMLGMMNAPAATHAASRGEHGSRSVTPDGESACPMHPEVRGGPGDRCPGCGMRLERRDDSASS